MGTPQEVAILDSQCNECLTGIRTKFNIRFLQEHFADNGQYAFLASLRTDVQLAQPAAFVIELGLRS